ncbi:hypothetical protein, partial [uncultured Chitinibacter sp.]
MGNLAKPQPASAGCGVSRLGFGCFCAGAAVLLGVGANGSSWFGAIFFDIRVFENQSLIDLLALFRLVGVDAFSMGGYSSASLLMTQRNK